MIRRFYDWIRKAFYGPYYQPPRTPSEDSQPRPTIPLDECLYWGRSHIPRKKMDPHSLIVGTTSSGKSWLLRMLARAALLYHDDKLQVPIDGKLKCKAAFYDGKNQLLALLPAMGIPQDKIHNFNPYEIGCVRWAISEDITTRTHAHHLAGKLFPDKGEKGENAFFPAAARDLLTNVMFAFTLEERPDWTLYDAIKTVLSADAMRTLFDKFGDNYIINTTGRNYLTMDHKTFSGVIGNITQFIAPHWPIACLWENLKISDPTRRLSLTKWAGDHTPSVIVFSRKGDARTQLDAFNEVLLSRIDDIIQGYRPIPHAESGMDTDPRLWLFLDELHLAGELHFLHQLITMASGQGARIVLAFQDINSLHHLYGKEKGDVIANMCGNLAGLRVNSIESAQWLSNRFGNVQYVQKNYNDGTSTNPDGKDSFTTGTTRSIQQKPWIDAHWFQNEIPLTTKNTGLTGAFRIAGTHETERQPVIWKETITPEEIIRYGGTGEPIDPQPRPDTDQLDPHSNDPPQQQTPSTTEPKDPVPEPDKPKQPRFRSRRKDK